MFNTVTIVGVGLIGGSFSLALKDYKLVNRVIGVSRTGATAQRALELGIVDEVLPLEEAVRQSDLIYLAIPVDVTLPVMKTILDLMNSNQIVVDAGSTKQALCKLVSDHPNRSRFVASHPMWGTEYSGPDAAVHDAFRGRTCVICEREKSDPLRLYAVGHAGTVRVWNLKGADTTRWNWWKKLIQFWACRW